MTDSLKQLLMDQLTDLHDALILHLDVYPVREVLGEELDDLRSTGTGKSLVMLALLDDLLRITEIILDQKWERLEPDFARFAAPFFQSIAKTFSRKGLKQYGRFVDLSEESAGRFLAFHWQSGQPFGGQHKPTEWAGLRICTNIAERSENISAIDHYERLAQTLMSALEDRLKPRNRNRLEQVADFVSDRCQAVRDQYHARTGIDADQLSQEREELSAWREELETQQAQLREREHLILQEWNRFRQERAEFEQLRQQWEEQLPERGDPATEWERLANLRETLASEKAAIEEERRKLRADHAEWERRSTEMSPADNINIAKEKALLAEERGRLDEERAALWNEREELAALREQLLAEQPQQSEEHVLFEPDPSSTHNRDNAAIVGTSGVQEMLITAAAAGELDHVRAALEAGADVDSLSPEHDWRTALHLAASRGHAQIVEVLLSAGANALKPDGESLNPLESAIINEQSQTARLLAARAPETVSQAAPVLLKILRDTKSPAVSRRLCAEVIGLGGNSSEETISTLLHLLESDARELSLAAAEAIAKINPDLLTRRAVPHLSDILAGPLVQNTGESPWVANLFAVRGDLHRLVGAYLEAVHDYQSALNIASPALRSQIQPMLDRLKTQAAAGPAQKPNSEKLPSPQST